jgi:very-short-patch-repair endonuclease
MTDTEQRLWARLRRKNLLGVQFYRQKPLGHYIVDFYAPRAGLVVEIDGSQHLEAAHVARDAQRDAYLTRQRLQVLRFHTTQILQELDAVVEVIFRTLEERLAAGKRSGNPP